MADEFNLTFEEKTQDIMRALAMYVSAGGYNDSFDLDLFDSKIRSGIDGLYEINNNVIAENSKLKQEILQLKVQKYNLLLELLVTPSREGITPIEILNKENPVFIQKLKELL